MTKQLIYALSLGKWFCRFIYIFPNYSVKVCKELGFFSAFKAIRQALRD